MRSEKAFPVETVKEGDVSIVVPRLAAYVESPSDYAPSKAPVFYNPVMEFNRDISVLAVQSFQRKARREISICEPLSSSGVRGIRFAAEIHGVNRVFINDISLNATKLAENNVRLNSLQERVIVSHEDANCFLSCQGRPHQRFDVVDLDPFGSPVRYIDSAIRALRDGGLLALTATDLAPLCGVHANACIRKYGGKPLRTEYCHELAVRLLAGCVATSAAKHEIGVNLVFCHSTDHYVRAYFEVSYGAKEADENIRSLGYLLHCFTCLHREIATSPFSNSLKRCPECGSRLDYAGPLMLANIFDRRFCELMAKESSTRAFRNSAKISRLLSLTEGESDATATYYVLDKISSKLSLPVPPLPLALKELKMAGFQAVPTHFNSRGIRSDAPSLEIQKLMKGLASSV